MEEQHVSREQQLEREWEARPVSCVELFQTQGEKAKQYSFCNVSASKGGSSVDNFNTMNLIKQF